MHIPGLGFDGLIGYSPIAMAKNAIGMAIATEEYGAKFFANGANPGGVLEHPGIVKDPARVRESWNSVYQGTKNAHRVAVLEEGMKFQSIGIPPEQAQLLQTRKFQLNEIARIFRIPPHMIGDLDKSSFSNIEQQSLEFVMYTLDPWVVRWEQAIKRALFTESEKKQYFVKFNVDGLLRGDYQSRMNGYAVGRQNGWLSKMMDAETWFSAKKAVELGFADKVLYENTEENATDGFSFDKVTVTNTLLRKIPKVKQTQPIVETGTPHEQLEKRLDLLKY